MFKVLIVADGNGRVGALSLGLAEKGFLIGPGTAAAIDQAFEDFPAHARAFYGTNGRPLRSGDRLVQTDLARSLRLVAAEGSRAFYGGDLGRAIDAAMRGSGGALRLDDLRADRAEWWEPIHVPYRGHVVYTASPPSTAFPSLVRLGLMSRFDVARLGHNSTEFLHRFLEVTKHAFWCRLRYAGDPGVSRPPLDLLLSEKYWTDQAARIDPARAKPFVYPGARGEPDRHTTHFVVADAEGNIVSATQTLGNAFGSRIMPEGTGIWLNNSLAYCTFEPKGNPMDAHPGRRKLSGDCPTIIVKGGQPWAALGTPGGHTIGQTVPQIVMNLIDFGMDIQRAIDAPRVSFHGNFNEFTLAASNRYVREGCLRRGRCNRLQRKHDPLLDRQQAGETARLRQHEPGKLHGGREALPGRSQEAGCLQELSHPVRHPRDGRAGHALL